MKSLPFVLSIHQCVTQRLELQCQVHGLDHHIIWYRELNRREVEDGLDPKGDQTVGDGLRHVSGSHQDGHVERLSSDLFLEVRDIEDGEAIPLPADFRRVAVEDGNDVEPTLLEPAVLNQRAADLPRPYHADTIASFEPENSSHLVRQLWHRIAESAFAERPEERQIFSDLRRGCTAP